VLAVTPSRRLALPLRSFKFALSFFPRLPTVHPLHSTRTSSDRVVESNYDNLDSQCAKRDLPCQYPLTSRRGQRKPSESAADGEGALGGSPPSNGTGNARARASSKLSTSSLFSDA
jgi:hypothetical protein